MKKIIFIALGLAVLAYLLLGKLELEIDEREIAQDEAEQYQVEIDGGGPVEGAEFNRDYEGLESDNADSIEQNPDSYNGNAPNVR
ncbi:MAG: hypothetical protein HON23_02955 [Rickettsiales bacterium]|jgi:hypothetical protein|nr:hypothetical protein [Rickettsiales bacterium]